jgi:hypothetical protein
LSHFLSEEDLTIIEGDGLFSNLPEISFPNFTIYQADTKGTLASDDKARINMNRMVEQIKKEALVVSDLADNIVLGRTRVQVDSPWTDQTGIGLIVALAVAGVVGIHALYLSVRLRTIAVAIAVLQNAGNAEAQNPTWPTVPPRFRINAGTTEGLEKFDLKLHILEPVQNNWIFLVVGALGIVAIYVTGRYLIKRLCQSQSGIKIKTQIAFQFTGNDGRSLFLKWMQLGIQGEDLELFSKAELAEADFRIKGWFVKRLTFNFPGRTKDLLTDSLTPWPQETLLRPYEAILLERILRQKNVVVRIVLIQGGRVTNAEVFYDNTIVPRKRADSMPSAPPLTPDPRRPTRSMSLSSVNHHPASQATTAYFSRGRQSIPSITSFKALEPTRSFRRPREDVEMDDHTV